MALDPEAAHVAAINLLTAASELVRVTSPTPAGPQPPNALDYAQKCVLLADQRLRECGVALGMTPDSKDLIQ